MNARIIVDGTGQNGLLARRLSQRLHIRGLQNASVYAHFSDVVLDDGIDAGSTLIYRLKASAWLWFIPLPDRVSIGLVAPAEAIASFGRSPTVILGNAIDTCPFLVKRLREARRTTEVRAVRDYSYRAREDGGAGWALVGDALGFIDPIYSTGLFLTMFSAELAAEAIVAALAGKARHPDLAGFSGEYQTAFDRFLWLVRAFYTEDFHFAQLARIPEQRQGLIDLLTGIVGTCEAAVVTDKIRDFFGERAAFLEGLSEGRA